MNEILVYILITISGGTYNAGNTTVIGHFSSSSKCEEVRRTFNRDEETYRLRAVCVPAIMIKEKL